ncbi:hypothetical protein SDC9_70153 [bioreactor metagenome]|uniref:Uncharacterized protein n=1 Tax=bioreactor metagenome TaxID=1076179 RepID=A0A644Y5V1_9ZZZZ
MPCGKKLAVERQRPLQKRAELYGAVALRAGIGRPSRLVFRNKVRNDRAAEHLRKIKHIKGNAQPRGHGPGVLRVRQGAAGLLPAFAQILVVKQAQVHAGHVISRLPQQQRGHGAVHPPAHSEKNTLTHENILLRPQFPGRKRVKGNRFGPLLPPVNKASSAVANDKRLCGQGVRQSQKGLVKAAGVVKPRVGQAAAV